MPADRRTLIDLEMRSDFVRRHIGPGESQIEQRDERLPARDDGRVVTMGRKQIEGLGERRRIGVLEWRGLHVPRQPGRGGVGSPGAASPRSTMRRL